MFHKYWLENDEREKLKSKGSYKCYFEINSQKEAIQRF